jgi:glycine/D-amino acid oxidase-like deaminating enzyme
MALAAAVAGGNHTGGHLVSIRLAGLQVFSTCFWCPGCRAGGFLALDWNDSSPIGPLARRSYALHAELAQELGAESTGYRPVNTHSISVRQGQAGPVSSSGASKRLPSLPGWVARDHISQASVIGTHENTAQVHPELFTNALLQRMQEAGGSVQIAAVTGLVTEGDRVTAVKARDSISGEDRVLQADAVVFACGKRAEMCLADDSRSGSWQVASAAQKGACHECLEQLFSMDS